MTAHFHYMAFHHEITDAHFSHVPAYWMIMVVYTADTSNNTMFQCEFELNFFICFIARIILQ